MFLNLEEFLSTYVARDNWRTTLSQDFGSGEEVAYLTSVEDLPSKGWLSIGEEYVFYNYLNSGLELVSGVERSDPEDHLLGEVVFQPLSAEVVNYIVEGIVDRDTLRDDLYVAPSSNSEDYRDIFDFMDNFQAVNSWTQNLNRYLSSSGEQIYVDSGVSDLPNRGWVSIYGEDIFYNSKTDAENTLDDLYRSAGVEHFKYSPVEQLINYRDWNLIIKAVANVTMPQYTISTSDAADFFSYELPSADGEDIDIYVTITTPGNTSSMPVSGHYPIFGMSGTSNELAVYLEAEDTTTCTLRVMVDSVDIVETSPFTYYGTHNIRFKLEGTTYTIWREDVQQDTGTTTNASLYDTYYLGQAVISPSTVRMANVAIDKVQGTWNNGRPFTSDVRSTENDDIDTIENLSYLGGNFTQTDSSFQGKYLLY